MRVLADPANRIVISGLPGPDIANAIHGFEDVIVMRKPLTDPLVLMLV